LDVGNGAEDDPVCSGIGGDEGDIAQAHEAQEQGLVHDVVFDTEEFQFVQSTVQDPTSDLQALRGEFIESRTGNLPSDHPHADRHDERHDRQSSREGYASQGRGGQ
jgi:hypothetical protein